MFLFELCQLSLVARFERLFQEAGQCWGLLRPRQKGFLVHRLDLDFWLRRFNLHENLLTLHILPGDVLLRNWFTLLGG